MENSICFLNTSRDSCLNDREIEKFIKLYNKVNFEKIHNKQDYIKKFGGKNEWKIVRENIFKDDLKFYNNLKNFTFKPFITKYSLVSNFDIDKVLKQFQHKFKNYHHEETVSCDFYNYMEVEEFQKLVKKMFIKDKASIVINTDLTNKPGKHWTCIFIDNKLKTIEFFDSLGDEPNKFTQKFINTLAKAQPKYNVLYSFKEIQKKNRECGIYVVRYIIKRLYDYPSFNLMNDDFPDANANAWRQQIFRL